MAVPRPRVLHRNGGFTLLEIMVVIAIGAVLVTMVTVSFNLGGTDKQLREEAERLYQLLRLVGDDAVFQTTEYGIRFTQSEYTFYSLQEVEDDDEDATATTNNDTKKKKKRRWLEVTEKPHFRSREWPEDLRVALYVEGVEAVLDELRDVEAEEKNEKLRPHVMFLSNGESMPDVEVHLSHTETEDIWRIGPDEDGLPVVEPLLD